MSNRGPVLSARSERPIDEGRDLGYYRGRNVTFWTGYWPELRTLIPEFELGDFSVVPGSAHPDLRAVIRRPHLPKEAAMPVGVVSLSYRLIQHATLIELCLDGLGQSNTIAHELPCDLGLSPLGEWMQFSLYFPERFKSQHARGMDLRLTCLNSVDGGSGLIVVLGWLTQVCRNGMAFGEALVDFRKPHNGSLRIDSIPGLIAKGLASVERDVARLHDWEKRAVTDAEIGKWADSNVASKWGKKAACRFLHICLSGFDVDIARGYRGKPTP